jgi:uncharacterized membrane protein YqjE
MEMSDTNSLTKRDSEPESLPALFTKMADDLTQLFDTKLALLRVELEEEVSAYTRGAMAIVIGGVIVAVGFALLNVAIAFLVSTIFGSSSWSQPVRYALGFIITSLIYLIGGSVVILITKNRLARIGIVPKRTVAELERDKEWLQTEVK